MEHLDGRALLLLGILKAQSQHGYQINEFIEQNLSRVTDMKKATAYAILDRLSHGGYVVVQTEQAGNRPPRKVYSITELGERLFVELLRENLGGFDAPTFAGDIGLMFLDELPRDDALECLRQRLDKLARQIAALEQAPAHGHGLGVDLALDHLLHALRADRDWLSRAVARLAAEGSAGPSAGVQR